ncbi:hypothetical protein PFISCL1PPCAC_9511 [Pristionchus fissidentatus]|uniref:Uncharacterized protein n=1 Tax=Pristionchus fissidentatus TaxID=1538716 RepID=A0AAV5VFN6_9BILA|nr:hypothetical protein PFISCL1PPCAC_9511 [Pristionchus fissidentatus]
MLLPVRKKEKSNNNNEVKGVHPEGVVRKMISDINQFDGPKLFTNIVPSFWHRYLICIDIDVGRTYFVDSCSEDYDRLLVPCAENHNCTSLSRFRRRSSLSLSIRALVASPQSFASSFHFVQFA